MKLKIIFLISVIVVLSLFFLFYEKSPSPKNFVSNQTFEKSENLFFEYEILRYPTSVNLIEPSPQKNVSIGVVVDPWNLKFGTIPTGGNYVRRYVVLKNLQEKKAKIEFKVFGDISPLVSFSSNNFLLSEDENITITVFLNTTKTTPPGNYSGEIDVVTKRPKYDFLYNLLGWF